MGRAAYPADIRPWVARHDIPSDVIDSAAELIRAMRTRHGISQRALAIRAGTTQAWVSAIECGRAQPTVGMLRRLLLVMGEELVLDTRRMPSDATHDPLAFAENRRRTPEERLEEALDWAELDVE